MSQYDFGTIDPDTKNGTDLAVDLNSWRDALHSSHRGGSRPAYLTAGGVWVKEVSGTSWQLIVFDGTNDVVVSELNPSTGVFTLPGGSVDNAAIGDGEIATAKMASANISQWTNNSLYAQRGVQNTFTTRQNVDMGALANAIAFRWIYETTGTPTERYLQIKTPIDIAHPGGNPWQIDTPDALTFQTDGVDALRIDGGGDVEAAKAFNVVGAFTVGGSPLTDNFSDELLHVRDQKSNGTEGGTFTSGAWRTRDLNTVVTNQISGASLSANRISLPAGDYVLIASAPAFEVVRHKAKLRNITDGSDIELGTSEQSNSIYPTTTRSFICKRFTIAGTKSLEIQHQCSTTKSTDGFGAASSFGVVEVYTEVMVWKVG